MVQGLDTDLILVYPAYHIYVCNTSEHHNQLKGLIGKQGELISKERIRNESNDRNVVRIPG